MDISKIIDQWQLLTVNPAQQLTESMIQLHVASQFIGLTGKTYLPQEEDDSQTNMGWDIEKQALTGRWIKGKKAEFRLALQVPTMRLMIQDKKEKSLAELSLAGWTKNKTRDWLKDKLDDRGLDETKLNMRPHYDLPEYDLDRGASFKLAEPPYFQEIARYRTNAHLLLEALATKFSNASDTRIWPHHFDTGVYIPLVKDADGTVKKSISLGWAINDSAYDAPYFYNTLWPFSYEQGQSMPQLACGHWHTDDFVGAVLPMSDLLIFNTAEEQAKRALRFFETSIDGTHQLLGLEGTTA